MRRLYGSQSNEYLCGICGYWGTHSEKYLKEHGRLRHGAAYRANLGPGDGKYEAPLSSLMQCPVCLIYVGNWTLQDHLENTACKAVAAANPAAQQIAVDFLAILRPLHGQEQPRVCA